MTKPRKKAAGYIRVSSPGQAKEGESLTTQRQQITDFAKQKGWELTKIYADEGISGSKAEHRTQFQQMLKDAKAGQFDVILFTKLSRFARNAREYLNFSYELGEYGVALASIKENLDPTTKMGKLIAGILALFAEWELETIREQMHENRQARWDKHETFIGLPPYAYKWNKETNQLEVEPVEADLYKRIVTMYVDQCMSFGDVAAKLNDEGLRGKRGAKWSASAISYLLKKPAYYGHLVVNQFEYEDGPQGAGNKRTKKRKPASENITFPIPALISKGRWNQIQERIKFNKVKSKRFHTTKEFFLRDVLICGRCGGRIRPLKGPVKKDGSTLRYYVCYWARACSRDLKRVEKTKCSLPYIPAQDIENRVWSDILVMFSLNPERTIGELYEPKQHESRINALSEQVSRLEKDLARKQKARKNVYDLLEDEDFDLNELKEKLQSNKDAILDLESKIKDTKGELQELQELESREQELQEFIKSNKDFFKKIRHEINHLDLEDRKILIESMLDGPIKVDYEPASEDSSGGPDIEIHWKRNLEVLRRFIEEGKISKLDKNGYNNLAAHNHHCSSVFSFMGKADMPSICSHIRCPF